MPVFTLKKEGAFEIERAGEPTVLVTRVGDAEGSWAAAAALACAAAEPDRASLLIDFSDGRAPRPTLVASTEARKLEERLAVHLPDAGVASRGQVCRLTLPPDAAGIEAARAATTVARGSTCVLHLPPRLLQGALEDDGLHPSGALLRADLDPDRSLTALVVGDLHEKGLRAAVLKRPLGWIAARRALSGALPPEGGGGLPARLRALLLAERGQALPLALGGALVLILTALALVAIAGAITGKGRVQRAADLAAISAVRSMRDDLPRLLSPPTLPNGLPNPLHLEKPVYLLRARVAALQAARANGVAPARLRVSFPDAVSFAPVRARAKVLAEVDAGKGRTRIEATAVAEAAAPVSAGGMPAMASGGGYSGPLAYRQGEDMRPDVAAAFDRMAAAAVPGRHLPRDQLRLPLRRRAGGPLCRQPRPAVGRPARPVSAPLRDRARPRSRRPPTAGWPPTPADSASSSATHGKPGTTVSRKARRPARRPATSSARVGETAPPRAPAACPPSFRPATASRCCAPRRAGTSPPRCSPRS